MMAEERKGGEGSKADGSSSGVVNKHVVATKATTAALPRMSSTKSDDTPVADAGSSKSRKMHRVSSSSSSEASRPSTSKGKGKSTRTSELMSENCKKFNRLFHCSGSEDSTSSSDTVIEIAKDKLPVNSSIRIPVTAHTDSTSKLAINTSTQYFHHDEIHSPFKPAALSSNARESTPGSSIKKATNHGISQMLSNLRPVADPSVRTIKSEIKKEKDVAKELSAVSGGNVKTVKSEKMHSNRPEKQEVKIKEEPASSWGDLELEIQVQVDAPAENKNASIKTESDDDTSSPDMSDTNQLQENDGLVDESEDDAETEVKSEKDGGRGVAKRMDKESKKLLMQLNDSEKRKSSRLVSKTTFCNKKHEALIMKRLKLIIKKPTDGLTAEERQLKDAFPNLVRVAKKRLESRKLASERLKEIEDSPEELEIKCTKLAKVIKNANYLVVYTGAGISTSAKIPDYRGPNGIWTKLRNGESLDAQSPTVLTTADPTLTHMAIQKLHSERIIKHIVSQNCDGLHLRSGIPKNALSEVHGNMYIEVCAKCSLEYVRAFDVTEHTRRYEHRTGRHCYFCGSQLRDTVVHFGERGSLRWPLNWAGAEYNVARADVILCMGSSLKVLRRYPWLWGMDLPLNKRPKLYIVNLQWTPKDQFAALKIHGKCDEVMSSVMSKLNISIPSYERETDQIFALATPLHESEMDSKSSLELAFPPDKPWPTYPPDLNNYTRFEPKFIPADLKAKKEEDDLTQAEIDRLSKCDNESRILRSQIKVKLEKDSKKPAKKKRDSTAIIKGNGNGWFGNAWGKSAAKAKKRKTSTSKPSESATTAPVVTSPTPIEQES